MYTRAVVCETMQNGTKRLLWAIRHRVQRNWNNEIICNSNARKLYYVSPKSRNKKSCEMSHSATFILLPRSNTRLVLSCTRLISLSLCIPLSFSLTLLRCPHKPTSTGNTDDRRRRRLRRSNEWWRAGKRLQRTYVMYVGVVNLLAVRLVSNSRFGASRPCSVFLV